MVVGSTLGNLASLISRLGQLERAEGMLLEALEIHRHLGNRRSEMIAVGNLAELAELRGRDAVAGYREAVDRAHALGDARVEGHWRGRLAWALRDELEQALPEFDRALALSEQGGDRVLFTACLCLRVQVHAQHGQLQQGAEWLVKAKAAAPRGSMEAQEAIDKAAAALAQG